MCTSVGEKTNLCLWAHKCIQIYILCITFKYVLSPSLNFYLRNEKRMFYGTKSYSMDHNKNNKTDYGVFLGR